VKSSTRVDPGQSISFDTADQALVADAMAAFKEKANDRDWQGWVRIGRGIVAARNLYHLNAATGRAYSTTMGRWLEETGLAAMDKGVRSRLLTCIDNLAAIERWREAVGITRRMELTHPNAVLRNWQKATGGSEAKDKPAAPPLTRAEKDAEALRSLQEEPDAAHLKVQQFERANGVVSEGRDWTSQDAPAQIAQAMFRLYPDKAKRLGSALQRLAQSTTPKPHRSRPASDGAAARE
jgi:hypothetical protein